MDGAPSVLAGHGPVQPFHQDAPPFQWTDRTFQSHLLQRGDDVEGLFKSQGGLGKNPCEDLEALAQEATSRAETRLRHKTLVGTVTTGRANLGSFPKPRYNCAHGKEKCQLVLNEICAEMEEECCSKMVDMSKQGT